MQKYNAMIGTVLDGRYLLIGVIGVGGMAVVFSAYDRTSGDTVAVKMLRDDTEDATMLPSLRNQFANEAKALSQLSHTGVVKLYDSSLEKPPYYFVMEYVEGITLKEYISKKKILPQREVIDFSMQILSALSHIHSKGIVHCDIKPHNILLMRNGKVKITDFGIARMPGVIPDLPPDRAVGTVYYVSPEQAEGKVLDHRSDLYSLGIMMYQMSSGKLPFISSDIDKVARMQSSAPPRRPRTINPDISKGLEQIILKAMAKKPYMRFTNADDMRHYLDLLRKNPAAVFRLQDRSEPSESSAHHVGYHSHNAYAILAGVISAFIITLAVALPIIFNNISSTMDGSTVNLRVPDLRGDTLEEVAKKLDENLYDVEIIYDYNSLKAPGKVISQSPEYGTKLKLDPSEEQCKVTVTVSAQSKTLKLIDITSLSPDDAKQALINEGYTVKFEDVYSDTVAKGLACGTYPTAGTKLSSGSEVTVYVSLGPDIVLVTVPDFSGQSESAVAAELKDYGFRVGKVTYKASHLPAGTVISQSAKAYDTIPQNTAIDFVVSGGPNYNP